MVISSILKNKITLKQDQSSAIPYIKNNIWTLNHPLPDNVVEVNRTINHKISVTVTSL